MTPEFKARIDSEIAAHPVVLFMKGNALFPQCGFSAAAIQILQQFGPVHTLDVLQDQELREGIKQYSNWPTIPQIYVHGKFVGGSDILRELASRGELESLIKGS